MHVDEADKETRKSCRCRYIDGCIYMHVFILCVCVCVGVIGKEEHDEQDIVICIDRLCTIFTGVLETVLETA